MVDARLRPGMLVRDYTQPDRSGYGAIWEVVDVQLKLDGVLDFLKEGLFELELSNNEILRTLILPASMPGFEILTPELAQTRQGVPIAKALPYVGYPLFPDGLEDIARVSGSGGWPSGYPILTEIAFRSHWQTGWRYYHVAVIDKDGLGYGFDVDEQDAQTLAIYPAQLPANRYTPAALGRTKDR